MSINEIQTLRRKYAERTKIFFLTAYILCTLTLSACDSESPDITTVSLTPDTTLSSVQKTISVSENEITDTQPVTSISEQTNADIVSEIKQTLTEFKDFSYNYLQCKVYMFEENLDTADTLTVDDRVYYRAISGDYTRYSDLMAAIDRYCSEDVISECSLKKYSYYEGDNDSLYIWKDANSSGGVMGSDTAYITSVEILDDNSVKVNMTAWGDKEEWGYADGDSVIPFEITMTSENDLWKIDKCGLMEMAYITWLFDADY